MQIENMLLRWEDVPATYAPCFCADCPLAEECLRYAVGQVVPASVTSGLAIYPAAYREAEGGQCRHFRPRRVVRMAWGFGKLYTNVLARHDTLLRKEVMRIAGSQTSYYRYQRGERHLTPAQQQEITDLFVRYGYPESSVRFEHYCEEIDFSKW